MKTLFEYEDISEEEAISNYRVMYDLVTCEDYQGLDFYYFCNKKYK